MKRVLALGISAGVLAAILATILSSPPFNLVSWIGFVAMLTFFSTKGGVEGLKITLATNLSGVFWGVMLLVVTGFLASFGIHGQVSLAISVIVFVIIMCMQSYFKLLSFIPGAFAGCSCYFASATTDPLATDVLVTVIASLVVGGLIAISAEKIGGKLGDLFEMNRVSKTEGNPVDND